MESNYSYLSASRASQFLSSFDTKRLVENNANTRTPGSSHFCAYTAVQLSFVFDCCQFLLHSGLSEMYHPVQILADLLTLQVTVIDPMQIWLPLYYSFVRI